VHHTTAVPRGQIRPGADRIVAPVGARVLGDKADRTGLTGPCPRPGHARISDTATLTGARCSPPWWSRWPTGPPRAAMSRCAASTRSLGTRGLDSHDAATQTALTGEALPRIAAARAATRRRVWAEGLDPKCCVSDIGRTWAAARRTRSSPTPDKHRDGICPLSATLGATGEPLTALVRVGHGRGPSPAAGRRARPVPVELARDAVILRTDSAECSQAVLNAWAVREIRFFVGHPLTGQRAATVIGRRDCGTRGGDVAELTAYGDLRVWAGKALTTSRRQPPAGAPRDPAARRPEDPHRCPRLSLSVVSHQSRGPGHRGWGDPPPAAG
jgi:hypothetical protein